MDGEPEHEENEVKNETERETPDDSSNEKDNSPVAVDGNEKEGVPAEEGASHHEEENSESMKATGEPHVEAVNSDPEENSGDELPGVDNVTTSIDLDVRVNEVNEQSLSQEESVVFEINSNDNDGSPRLHLETPERAQTTSPAQEGEKETEDEEVTAAPAENEDTIYEEYMQLLQELCEEKDKASQHSSQLQMKLAEYLRKKAGDDAQLEREMLVSEQLQEYEKYINILTDVKQQLTADSETAQQQAEELRLQSQEKLDKVENEWQAFMALKQHVAVTVLSRCLGKQVAQAKVESTLSAEQFQQDELIKLRLKHIKLRIKIHRLEAELRDREERSRDPLQLQFEQLQAARLEQKKEAEKQSEELLKLQNKISSSLELLSNIKEKLFWTQMEVQAKREQLAEVEASVARKRDLLTRTKQARNSLQRDNLRLKECRGLLGNRVLLRDFEDSVDASDRLEEQLENLKCRQAEIVFSCGRWKKKLETA
ncbi:LOW QUALITY PROTEIN: coiled-coil domain-containing protein 96 [Lates calcarifer]|uniref:LOW QUALITY PROTEIN: coiled-coil domain-containing protein 96 n=1 Tax=Lates calcarifer TaxID=8187 RepID=A0AAJ7LQX9_LATCA|nr:LOW QUALITY PROTEIN: coiled-coil domain-containing protein 96 [Lates calcarifer]